MPEMVTAQMEDNNAAHGRKQENLYADGRSGWVIVFCRRFSEFH